MHLGVIIAIVVSLLSIVYAFYLAKKINREPAGEGKMIEISSYIREGATAFLKRQYRTIAIIAIGLALLLFFVYRFTGDLTYGFQISAAFIFGAAFSLP